MKTMGEFDLIERFFKAPARAMQLQANHPGIQLGIGDDCALLQPAPSMQMAISNDIFVATHKRYAISHLKRHVG